MTLCHWTWYAGNLSIMMACSAHLACVPPVAQPAGIAGVIMTIAATLTILINAKYSMRIAAGFMLWPWCLSISYLKMLAYHFRAIHLEINVLLAAVLEVAIPIVLSVNIWFCIVVAIDVMEEHRNFLPRPTWTLTNSRQLARATINRKLLGG